MTERYRVLKERFVYRHGVLAAPERRQPRAMEFIQGDEFIAKPAALLRRACRDHDLERVELADGKRRGPGTTPNTKDAG